MIELKKMTLIFLRQYGEEGTRMNNIREVFSVFKIITTVIFMKQKEV